jgi:hypothetical protein
MLPKRRWGTKRRWGYGVWVIAGGVIAVPELIAASNVDLPWFSTISAAVGHLERYHTWVELLVVAAIVFLVFSLVRLSPELEPNGTEPKPGRTPGGRLTLSSHADAAARGRFDDDQAQLVFALAAATSVALVALATWAAVTWWDDEPNHFHPAFVLYGLLFLLWLVVPSLVAFFGGRDVPFPTLFRSISNLEDWLKKRRWRHNLGPLTAWVVSYVILAGLVILLLHLTLFPYPDITHIIDPTG